MFGFSKNSNPSPPNPYREPPAVVESLPEWQLIKYTVEVEDVKATYNFYNHPSQVVEYKSFLPSIEKIMNDYKETYTISCENNKYYLKDLPDTRKNGSYSIKYFNNRIFGSCKNGREIFKDHIGLYNQNMTRFWFFKNLKNPEEIWIPHKDLKDIMVESKKISKDYDYYILK